MSLTWSEGCAWRVTLPGKGDGVGQKCELGFVYVVCVLICISVCLCARACLCIYRRVCAYEHVWICLFMCVHCMCV